MIVINRWQSDLENTKDIILPVCHNPYYTNKRKSRERGGIEVLRNCVLILTHIACVIIWFSALYIDSRILYS